MTENDVYEALNNQDELFGVLRWDGTLYAFEWNQGKWMLRHTKILEIE